MNIGHLLFTTGLIVFMVGIYLSTKWVIIGSITGIFGGMMMGAATHFLAGIGAASKKNK
ncbi:hypothetical protein ACOJQI_13185 [Bacillus salacetis]|uniref:hypothetical protein n=1 Tax=Bacillus salacetis TaxID=2315464 RepID=UPI003BA0059F